MSGQAKNFAVDLLTCKAACSKVSGMGQKKKLLRQLVWQGEELKDLLTEDDELPTAYVLGLKIRSLFVRPKVEERRAHPKPIPEKRSHLRT